MRDACFVFILDWDDECKIVKYKVLIWMEQGKYTHISTLAAMRG